MHLSKLFLLVVHITLCGSTLSSDNLRREINLAGKWKFQVGNKDEYAKSDYDDSDWDNLYVPSNWENSGYDCYDGMAWYRINVHVPNLE